MTASDDSGLDSLKSRRNFLMPCFRIKKSTNTPFHRRSGRAKATSGNRNRRDMMENLVIAALCSTRLGFGSARMRKLKALLLIPAAAAGVLSALAIRYPPKEAAELGFMVAIILPLYLINLAVLGWTWTKPAGGRFFGFTRGTWSTLVTIAYLVGLSLMLVM